MVVYNIDMMTSYMMTQFPIECLVGHKSAPIGLTFKLFSSIRGTANINGSYLDYCHTCDLAHAGQHDCHSHYRGWGHLVETQGSKCSRAIPLFSISQTSLVPINMMCQKLSSYLNIFVFHDSCFPMYATIHTAWAESMTMKLFMDTLYDPKTSYCPFVHGDFVSRGVMPSFIIIESSHGVQPVVYGKR